jgi:hypothetical protein
MSSHEIAQLIGSPRQLHMMTYLHKSHNVALRKDLKRKSVKSQIAMEELGVILVKISAYHSDHDY